MATGYFKLYRPLQDHWVYSDSRYLHLWIDCLINARWSTEPKKDVYKGVMYTIERGQFLFSRKTYSDRLKIDESVIRRCIEMMIKEDMISVVLSLGKNKPTIYQVTNFDRYNPLNEPSESAENKGFQVYINPVETQSKPSGGPVETTKEESNKEKNKNIAQIDEFFESCWSMYPNKKGKGKISDSKKEQAYKLGDEFKKAIESYKLYLKQNTWLHCQNGSTFWNSGYIDYIEQKQEDKKPLRIVEREISNGQGY